MVLRNLKMNDCYRLFKSSPEFRDIFKMLLSIPFLPKYRVVDDYELIKLTFTHKFGENQNITNFLNYFTTNFISIRNKKGYEYDLWNVYNRIMEKVPITNNSAEAYNKCLGDDFTNSHPSLVLFIQKLRIRDYLYCQDIYSKFSSIVTNSKQTLSKSEYKYYLISKILKDDKKYYELLLLKEIAKIYNWLLK
ncbi:hypothetical protein DMUE_4209 [Dictyocoela muelleri]|nr:hypothetical protein DMUE_4209 [Dictyocoela muelleri]